MPQSLELEISQNPGFFPSSPGHVCMPTTSPVLSTTAGRLAPQAGLPGLNICFPSGTTFLSPRLGPSRNSTDPFPISHCDNPDLERREKNYDTGKLKTQYDCSNFPGPGFDIDTPLYCCRGARARLPPTVGIVWIPQVGPDKGGCYFPHTSI